MLYFSKSCESSSVFLRWGEVLLTSRVGYGLGYSFGEVFGYCIVYGLGLGLGLKYGLGLGYALEIGRASCRERV